MHLRELGEQVLTVLRHLFSGHDAGKNLILKTKSALLVEARPDRVANWVVLRHIRHVLQVFDRHLLGKTRESDLHTELSIRRINDAHVEATTVGLHRLLRGGNLLFENLKS